MSTPTPATKQRTLNWSGTSNSLQHPAGLAVDLNGTLYVADHDNHRVLKLAKDSNTPNPMLEFSGDYALSWPSGVAVDSKFNVYVADTQNSRVLRLEAGTTKQEELPFHKPPLSTPEARLNRLIAAGEDGVDQLRTELF